MNSNMQSPKKSFILAKAKKLPGLAEKAVVKSSFLLNIVSCLSLTALMLIITLNVLLRAIFKSPILGAYDLTGFLTLIAIGCGLAYCGQLDGHIEISYFVDKMGGRINRWLTQVGRLVTSVLLAVYAYSLFAYGSRLMRTGEISVTTKTPLFIFAFVLSLCFTVFALTALLKIFVSQKKGEKNGS